MHGGTQKQGYTILEVLIFLAISSFMFVIAATFINGKQAKSEFKQGMNDLNSQIQQVINDVANGYYPSNGDFGCSAGSIAGTPLSFSGSSNGQGGNQGCAFIGKVMQFSVGAPDSVEYDIYSIVGRQFQTDYKNLVPPANFREAQPLAMTGAAGTPDLTVKKKLQWGLTVDKITANGGNTGAFGFFNGFATSNSDNKLDSGSATPTTVAFLNAQLGKPSSDADGWISALGLPPSFANIYENPNIVMCFKGNARQYGRLTLGTSDNVQGQKLITHTQITTGSPSAGCSA